MKVSSLLLILPFAVAQDGTVPPTNPPTPLDIYTGGIVSGYVQNITEGNGPTINQDRVVDYDYCYGALAAHDDSGNGRIDEAEFFDFAQDFGRNTECLSKLDELPLELRAVWNQLSCECVARGGADNCCTDGNAHIPITGVSPFDPQLVEEQNYLKQVCLRTDQAIVTWCGPPPPPIIPGPPLALSGAPVVTAPGNNAAEIAAPIIIIIFLIIWRRRWCFFPAGKGDEESSESSSESEGSDDDSDAGGMGHKITEGGPDVENPPPVGAAGDGEEGIEAEPEEDAMKLRAVDNEEDGVFGGTSYGRTVQEPEWEDIEGDRAAVYEQYELPTEGEDPMKLKPIPGKVKGEEEEPYDLEHYVPDGGIVDYEREGEWKYDADGGWTPEERAQKEAGEWDRDGYERAQHLEEDTPDRRRQRNLEGLGAGEIFNQLDEEISEPAAAAPDDMFDWVIRSTLNTLDQQADDLKGSHHDTDSASDA